MSNRNRREVGSGLEETTPAEVEAEGSGIVKAPPIADTTTRCEHENLFNHCRACMQAAGIEQSEMLHRIAHVDNALRGLPPPAPLADASVKRPYVRPTNAEIWGQTARKFRTS